MYRYEPAVGQSYIFLANNGVWYQVGNHCVFSADGGVGWQINVLDARKGNLSGSNKQLAGTHFKPTLNLNFAYQF